MRFDDAFTYYLRVNLACCVILKKIIVLKTGQQNTYATERSMPAAERFLFTGSFFITLKVYLNIGKHRSEDI